MIAGGIGSIRAEQVDKQPLPVGALLVQLGGPGMRIGLGGGAASSVGGGANAEQLDFDSVQRGNAEMQAACAGGDRRVRRAGREQSDPGGARCRSRGAVERAAGTGAWRRSGSAHRPGRDSRARQLDESARDLVHRVAGKIRAGDRAGSPGRVCGSVRTRALSVRGARAATAEDRLVVARDVERAAVDMPVSTLLGGCRLRSAMRGRCRCSRRRLQASGVDPSPSGASSTATPDRGQQVVPDHDRRPVRRGLVQSRPDGRTVANAGGRLPR